MKFEELSEQSQEKAREVLAELLRIKYQQVFVLDDDVVTFLAHKIRKAFVELESEEKLPEFGSSDT
ncbi:hypothetical protein QE177_04420 [Arsenophonus sp. aPb]|uniref:hypothetical protein n=1 Tax=Arsenophonus sp. aPb TaxID=3041619 RepID=UPI002469225F|nr:hypothetical protein [Arsenophonus sp. aPb]WGL99132.1 hypothetical protein QE177_04420 [Arsenophonus sp. aPb]